MTHIESFAKKYMSIEEKDRRRNERKVKKEMADHLAIKVAQFELGFKEQLPLLAEAGITYSAHYKYAPYDHCGIYITFKRGTKKLRMDFNNSYSYRYEYVPYSHNYDNYGNMTYGNWGKDKFIVWLYKELF